MMQMASEEYFGPEPDSSSQIENETSGGTKRKRDDDEEEGFYNLPKRIRCIRSFYMINVVGMQDYEKKIHLERSDGIPKMDAGVSPLLKGKGMEVDENVEEIGRNLPRVKSNNRHHRMTHPEPTNQHLSVRNTNRLKSLQTGSIGKDPQTRQPDRRNISKKNLVVNSSDRGRIVDLASEPKVTPEELEKIEQLFKYVNYEI
jgi:hypothetical protein